MELNLKKIIRLECIGMLLIFLIFCVFDFYPSLRKAGQLKEEIRLARISTKGVSQSEIEKQKKDLNESIERVKGNLEISRKHIIDIQTKVIQEKDISLLTQEIVDIATLSKIELASVKPLKAEIKKGYEVVPIDIQVQCEYIDIMKFLSNIESSSLLVIVRDISIDKNEAIYPRLNVNLTVASLFASE